MGRRLFLRSRGERGAALVEGALVIPLLLLIGVCIFEFGRVYQTWEVLTNAAREGARVAALPGTTDAQVRTRVQLYATNGAVAAPAGGWTSAIAVARNTTIDMGGGLSALGSTVNITYPFNFIVLHPVAQLIASNTTLGNAITLHATATMRNE
jgi:Flp pilus assembly protein TadG